MSLRNEWKTLKAELDALAKTHKAALENKDLKYVRSSKAFELGFGPLLDAYEKLAEKTERARAEPSTEQKAALKAAGLQVIATGAAYMKLLSDSRAKAERLGLPPALLSGIGSMQGTLLRIHKSVNSTLQRCGA